MIGIFVPRNLNLLYRVIEMPNDKRMRFEEHAPHLNMNTATSERGGSTGSIATFTARRTIRCLAHWNDLSRRKKTI